MYIERDFKFPDQDFFQLADLNTTKMLRKKDYEKKQDKKQENHKFPDRGLFSVGGTRMSGW